MRWCLASVAYRAWSARRAMSRPAIGNARGLPGLLGTLAKFSRLGGQMPEAGAEPEDREHQVE